MKTLTIVLACASLAAVSLAARAARAARDAEQLACAEAVTRANAAARPDAPALVIPAGAKVAFLNSDPIVHSVQVISFKNEGANHTISPGAREEMTFAKGDKISIKCGYHPWMSGWIFVSETPYCALTKPDGTFS